MYTHTHTQNRSFRIPVIPYSYKYLVLSVSSISAILVSVWQDLTVILILIFLMIHDMKHLFIYVYWPHGYLFYQHLLKCPTHFSIRLSVTILFLGVLHILTFVICVVNIFSHDVAYILSLLMVSLDKVKVLLLMKYMYLLRIFPK